MGEVARIDRDGDGWCILCTSGPKTIALATSLTHSGFDVWTPTRTIRRPMPGQRRRLAVGRTRRLMEVSVPILSGFVLARARHKYELMQLAKMREGTNCPAFSVFLFAGDIITITEASIAGLRAAQDLADREIQALRDAESREEARKARVELMRTEQQRRKALRSESKRFRKGDRVIVAEAGSFSGLVGEIAEDSDGPTAKVDFGGRHVITAGAWQTFPAVLGAELPYGAAA